MQSPTGERRQVGGPPDLTPPARLASLPSWLLTQTARHAHRLVTEGFAEIDSRGYHYRLLLTLAEVGPTSQADLGRRSGIHLSDVVAAVNDLTDRQFVERSPDPTDRRRNVITLTPAGRRQLRRLDQRLTRIQDDLLAPLAPVERDQLTRLLTRLLEHHRSSPAADD
ncbi:MarR family winged helix-turn-helix transcriptional regulator [Plantactinospora veratri]|uniref:MarR family winged helix-turn-helix transcriptional regulator n=1 Tax=Plantactinospora veratri TaxID=1436122 RepID=A0ABU7SAU2_9ACTN